MGGDESPQLVQVDRERGASSQVVREEEHSVPIPKPGRSPLKSSETLHRDPDISRGSTIDALDVDHAVLWRRGEAEHHVRGGEIEVKDPRLVLAGDECGERCDHPPVLIARRRRLDPRGEAHPIRRKLPIDQLAFVVAEEAVFLSQRHGLRDRHPERVQPSRSAKLTGSSSLLRPVPEPGQVIVAGGAHALDEVATGLDLDRMVPTSPARTVGGGVERSSEGHRVVEGRDQVLGGTLAESPTHLAPGCLSRTPIDRSAEAASGWAVARKSKCNHSVDLDVTRDDHTGRGPDRPQRTRTRARGQGFRLEFDATPRRG